MPSGPPHPVSFTSIITSVDKPCPTSCHSRRYLSCPALSKAAIFHLRATLPLSSDLCSLNRVINKVINIKQHLRSLDAPSPSQATKATHDSWSPSWSFPGTDFWQTALPGMRGSLRAGATSHFTSQDHPESSRAQVTSLYCTSQILHFLQTQGLWKPCWEHFSSSIFSLHVCLAFRYSSQYLWLFQYYYAISVIISLISDIWCYYYSCFGIFWATKHF